MQTVARFATSLGGVNVSNDFEVLDVNEQPVPGLYAAGEILDVDGPCGGYNLQWAWASALLAARAMHERLKA